MSDKRCVTCYVHRHVRESDESQKKIHSTACEGPLSTTTLLHPLHTQKLYMGVFKESSPCQRWVVQPRGPSNNDIPVTHLNVAAKRSRRRLTEEVPTEKTRRRRDILSCCWSLSVTPSAAFQHSFRRGQPRSPLHIAALPGNSATSGAVLSQPGRIQAPASANQPPATKQNGRCAASKQWSGTAEGRDFMSDGTPTRRPPSFILVICSVAVPGGRKGNLQWTGLEKCQVSLLIAVTADELV